jgi:hypothetical protein
MFVSFLHLEPNELTKIFEKVFISFENDEILRTDGHEVLENTIAFKDV